MAIWIEEDAKVLVQGITGKQGMFHAGKMVEYGTNLVGGVTPGKGGQEVLGVPVFDSMVEAIKQTDADATVIYVPPPFAGEAIMEAANAIHTMHQNPIDKTCLTPHLEKMRKLFMKSIVARKDIKAGTELNLENITEKKPGTGIPGHHIKKFIGKTLTQNIKRDEQLTEDHFS